MATDEFAHVVLGAALAEGIEKLLDSMKCFRIEVAEKMAELGIEQEDDS